MKYSAITLLIIFSLIQPLQSQSIETWPEFHGPNRNNISPATGLLKKWPGKGPKMLWKATGLGTGFSAVAIVDNMIFTAGTKDKQTYIFAFDYKGKLKWKSPNGTIWKPYDEVKRFARNFVGSRGTPTVNDGRVYHLNELGRLAAFSSKDGKETWSLDIVKKFKAEPPKWGYSESVYIDGNNLLLNAGGETGYIIALNKKTGKTIWANTKIKGLPSYCSLLLVEDQGIRQIITLCPVSVLGLNADTGKLLWRVPYVNDQQINVSTPLYKDGYVYVSHGYGGGCLGIKLNYQGKKISAKQVWHNKEFDNHHGGIMMIGNYIYGTGSNKKGWYCIDPKNGKTIFRDRDAGKGSITYADGMFYFYSEKGLMSLVKPSTKSYQAVSQFTVPEGGSGQYWAHPVVFDGRLYVRHVDNLYVYNVKK